MNRIHRLLPVLLISLAVLLLTQLQYISGIINTPKDSIYLGTVHYPSDYFNYLSWMIQGEDKILSSTFLYTQENIPDNYARWQFVLAGRIFSILGIGVVTGYQIMVVLGRIVFLTSGYLFIARLFSRSELKRLFAFFFFTSSTVWPIIISDKGRLSFSYHNYWYNLGDVFSRFGNTPHHLLTESLMVLSLLVVIALLVNSSKYSLSKKIILLAILALSGLVIGSTNPAHWGIVVGCLFLLFFLIVLLFWLSFLRRHKLSVNIFSRIVASLAAASAFTTAGLPGFLYLKNLYSQPPFNVVRTWEAAQLVRHTFTTFFYVNGLIIIFAAVGVVIFIRKINYQKLVALSFFLFSFVFFTSVLSVKVGVTNVRFWPSAVYLVLAAFGSEAVYFFASIDKKKKKLILTLILIIYLLPTLISYKAQLSELTRSQFGNSFVYLPKDAYNIYLYVKRNIAKDRLFLVQWAFNPSFPALTGRKVFYGDPISNLTINADYKIKEASDFFGGRLNPKQAREFLTKNQIDYVLGQSLPHLESYPFLEKSYITSSVALLKVVLF